MAALTGILKVSPATMKSYASTFNSSACSVQKKTTMMLQVVDALCRTWRGEASSAYQRKFHALRDDMDRMFRMIKEHSEDLQKMAANYTQAEETIKGNISGLAEDVIV